MNRTQTLILFLAFVCVARETRSELDQYEIPEHGPHRQLLRAKATDQPLDVPNVPHRFAFFKKLKAAAVEKPSDVPELQVGCEEGFTDAARRDQANSRKASRKRREADDTIRVRRNFYRSPVRGLNVWQPQPYQINRPYVIPVLGHPSTFTIYYPPQPYPFNPSYSGEDPTETKYPGKPYLPPKQEPFGNRFGYPDNSDDNPVWEVVTRKSTKEFVPTRRPQLPGENTHPPLEHTPRPPSEDQFLSLSSSGETEKGNERTTTAAPAAPQQDQVEDGPGRCTWAIVSCCSANSASVRYNCFEQMNCPGAFWDSSPCDSDHAEAAIASIQKYYAARMSK